MDEAEFEDMNNKFVNDDEKCEDRDRKMERK